MVRCYLLSVQSVTYHLFKVLLTIRSNWYLPSVQIVTNQLLPLHFSLSAFCRTAFLCFSMHEEQSFALPSVENTVWYMTPKIEIIAQGEAHQNREIVDA